MKAFTSSDVRSGASLETKICFIGGTPTSGLGAKGVIFGILSLEPNKVGDPTVGGGAEEIFLLGFGLPLLLVTTVDNSDTTSALTNVGGAGSLMGMLSAAVVATGVANEINCGTNGVVGGSVDGRGKNLDNCKSQEVDFFRFGDSAISFKLLN